MPILAVNKNRYPKDWKQIADSIREREGQKCKRCKVPNGALVVRGQWKDGMGNLIPVWQDDDGNIWSAEDGRHVGANYVMDLFGKVTCVTIVLTVAHLDHVPENCDPSNLEALCQRCHNIYDAPHRAETRKLTKAKKQPELFNLKP